MMPNISGCCFRPYTTQVKPRKRLVLATITGALLIACLHPLMASAEPTFPDQSGQKPAGQLGSDARRDSNAPPPTSLRREEIEDEIQDLESERSELLTKYASAHPDVRAVERRLQVRRKQLEILKQAPNPPK